MKTLKEYLRDNGHIITVEDALDLCELVLTYELERIMDEEPHATVSIRDMENAVICVPYHLLEESS